MQELKINLNLVTSLFFLLLSFLIYFNALNNSFVLDDNFLIVKNAYIKNISLIPRLFKTDIFYFSSHDLSPANLYYRPLQELSYSADYFFWKLNPLGYHLTNILLHGLNSFILFLLISLIFKDKVLALLASILFCIHPIQVSVAGYITGRGQLLETFFMLLSLFCVVSYFMYQKKFHYILSLLLFVCALFSREGAVLLPLFVIICALFLSVDKKKILIYLIPYALIGLSYFVLRSRFMPCSKCNFANILSLGKISSFIWLTQEYLGQLILPAGLRTLFFRNDIFLKHVLLFLSFVITVYCLVKSLVFKKRIFMFAIILYFIGLIPTINLIDHISYFGTILCEHYVYFASIGLFIIIAYLIIQLSYRFNKLAKACVVACFSFYICLTIVNNANYKDEMTFYNHILSVDKQRSFVRVNLGNVYYSNKMYDKAIEQAKLMLAAEPGSWDAYLLLGNIFKAKGDIRKAIEFYKKTIAFNPVGVEGYLSLGITLAESDYNKEAETVLRGALIKFPDSTDIMRNLGALYANTGELEKAIKVWQQALILNPDDKIIKNNIRIAKELLKRNY